MKIMQTPIRTLGPNIRVAESLVNKFPNLLNKDNLSALNNYAEHKNVLIDFSDMGSDFFL